jgi:hypothetical protein
VYNLIYVYFYDKFSSLLVILKKRYTNLILQFFNPHVVREGVNNHDQIQLKLLPYNNEQNERVRNQKFVSSKIRVTLLCIEINKYILSLEYYYICKVRPVSN